MEEQQQPVIVMFRKFRDTGEIIAVFPELPGDIHGMMTESYMHDGGHEQASPNVVYWTSKATPQEYAELKRELESEPYNYSLDVRERTPKDAADKRRKAVRNG